MTTASSRPAAAPFPGRRVRAGFPAPCVLCGHRAICRAPGRGEPLHKRCAGLQLGRLAALAGHPLAGETSRRFAGTAQAAHDARGFARRALAGHPASDDAELIVTELFSNAIAYTASGLPGGTVTVTVRVTAGTAVVTVLDQGQPEAPLLAAGPGGLAEHGRGLVLVDALADDWGTCPDPAGRAVWFRCGGPAGAR